MATASAKDPSARSRRVPRRLASLVLVPLVAFVLSGCAEAPADAPPAREAGPNVVTDPGDYTNATSKSHLHDYWGGQPRVVVLDASHPGGTERGAGPGVAAGTDVPVMEFRPESGQVVPQGASAVEVTLSWTEAPGDLYARPSLWVQTAQDAQPWFVAEVAAGQTVPVPSTNERNDLPHQLLSAWVFQLRMDAGSEGFLRFKGSVEARAEAVRGLDIPLYPAHPDRWQGASEALLFDASARLSYVEDPVDHGCNGDACPPTHRPANGTIVPPGAQTVVVVLETEGLTTIGLEAHGPEQRTFVRLAPDEEQGGVRTYRLPVEANWDGPYAQQSQWEFRTFIEGPVPDGAASGAYRITATALRGDYEDPLQA